MHLQDYFTTAEAAEFLRLSKRYLEKLRLIGGGPSFLKISTRKVTYSKKDLEAWLLLHCKSSTSEYNK